MFSFFRPKSVDVPAWCSMEPTAYAAFQKLVLDHFPQSTAEEIFTGSIALQEGGRVAIRAIGLQNISNILRQLPQQAWKGRFAKFLEDIVDHANPDDFSSDELRRRLRLRNIARGTYGNEMAIQGPALADDLYAAFVIDLPKTISFATAPQLSRIADSRDDAFQIALQNHGTFRPSQTKTTDLGTAKSNWFSDPESLYVATFLIELHKLMRISKNGALVIVPTAHLLGIVNIESRGAINTLWQLPTIAKSVFGGNPHPCSRSMYWWQPGKIERIPEPVADDIEMIPGSDDFVRMLRAFPNG